LEWTNAAVIPAPLITRYKSLGKRPVAAAEWAVHPGAKERARKLRRGTNVALMCWYHALVSLRFRQQRSCPP
jgi:hypothetical protein